MIRSSRSALVLTLAALALTATPGRAQLSDTGPFQPLSSWYLHPTTTSLGITPNLPAAGRVWVDTDGNGLFNQPGDNDYPLPADHQAGVWNWRLTPSRRVAYVFGAPSPNPGCAGGTMVYFYRIPGTNGAALELLTSRCIARGIAQHGFYDDPASAQQIASIVENSDPIGSGPQRLHWVNLATGTFATSFPALNRVVTAVQASPSGLAAFVQSDASDGDNLADYSIVCLGSDHLGEVFNVGGGELAQLAPPVATAQMIDAAGQLRVQVLWPDANTVRSDLTMAGCIPSPPPPPSTGACCLPNGGCLGGVSSGTCSALGGTWSGAQSVCATAGCPPPPAPDLRVTLSGPSSVNQGDTLTWSITWRNQGTLSSSSVSVVDFVPSGVNFASVTNGGAWNAGARTVTWTLGTLGPGAQGSALIRVVTTCLAASATNGTYTISGSPGGIVSGTPAVTTTLVSPSAVPIGVTITSVPLAPEPLHPGDAVRHTIRLAETAGIVRPYLRTTFGVGAEMGVGQLLASAGGTFSLLGGSTLQWVGALGANATDSLVFTTVVTRCRNDLYRFSLLNNRSLILFANYCGVTVGQATPADTSTLAPPEVTLDFVPTNLNPAPGPLPNRVAVARPGATVQFELRVANTSAAPETVTTLSAAVPPQLAVANPPFVGTPPAGTSWNNATRQITWTGPVAAGTTTTIAFQGTLDTTSCGIDLDAIGGLSRCPVGHLSAGLTVILLRPAPNEALYAFADPTFGIRGISAQPPHVLRTLLCVPSSVREIFQGLARMPNGDLWLVGLPTVRVNPNTLDFEIFGMGAGPDLQSKLGISFLQDVARDPRDGTLVFTGTDGNSGLRVRRWNRATDQVSVILDDTSPRTWFEGRHVLVDDDGTIVVETDAGLLRIPPSGPHATWTSALLGGMPPSGLARDSDGAYLTTPEGFSATAARRLVRFDRATGTAAEIANLTSYVRASVPWRGLAVAPDQDVFLGGDSYLLGELHRQPALDGDTLMNAIGVVFVADAEFVDAVTTDAPRPGVEDRPSALTFSAPRPNPSRGPTSFSFALPDARRVTLAVYDVNGREVRRVVDGWLEAGTHAVGWDGRDEAGRALPAGLYFARLDAGGVGLTRKLTRAR